MRISVAGAAVLLAISTSALGGGPVLPISGYAWTARQPSDNVYVSYIAGSMSADGMKAFLIDSDGTLHQSSNAGATWTECRPAGDGSLTWFGAVMSGDGGVLLASASWKRLYLSLDSGQTWAETQPKGDTDTMWRVAVSADGGVLVAMETWGDAYVSTNDGTSWTKVLPDGDQQHDWHHVALSSDGSTIVLTRESGQIYRSDDTGSSWATVSSPDSYQYWESLAMSADGTRIVLAGDGSRLWQSVDSGVNWSQLQPAGDLDQAWEAAAMSSDGMRMAACTKEGKLYTTSDGGASWIQRRPAGNVTVEWRSLNMSADGTQLILGSTDGIAYTGEPKPTPTILAEASLLNINTLEIDGHVTDPGFSSVLSRGVCWNTSGNPTLSDNHLEVGSGLGAFEAQLAELTIGHTYHVRTYATNTQGTEYSDDQVVAVLGTAAPFWMGVEPSGSEPAAWVNGTLSADGSRIMLMDGLSRGLFFTGDSGATWSASERTFEFSSYFEAAAYSDCDMSDDGTVMAFTTGTPMRKSWEPKRPRGSVMYFSTDAGTTWATPPSNGETGAQWAGATVSADGMMLHTVNLDDRMLYTSTNAGGSWAQVSVPETYIISLCSSNDGARLAFSVEHGDEPVFMSNDAGQTWSGKDVTSETIVKVASSADGQIVYAVGLGLFISRDAGQTWSHAQPFGNDHAVCIRASCSPDGEKVLIGGLGRLALSLDGGNTWLPQLRSAGDVLNNEDGEDAWLVAAMSADGQRFVAGKYDGSIYLGEFPELQTVTSYEVTSAETTAAQGGGTVVSQSFVPVTARGLCWNTTGSPTVDDAHTAEGAGAGEFISQMTGLTPNTTYYVRAYATSALGTAYGEQRQFVTGSSGAPNLYMNLTLDSQDGEQGDLEYGVGDEAQFLLRVGNNGNAGANGVQVRIPIPPGSQFVSAELYEEPSGRPSQIQIALEGDELVITLPELAANDEVSLRITLKALVAGQISLTAQVTSAEQAVPVTAEPAVIDVQDDYYRIVRPYPLCGAMGFTPLFGLMLSLGVMRRRFRSR